MSLRHQVRRWVPPAIMDALRPPKPSPFILPEKTLDELVPGAANQHVTMPMSQWHRTRDMVLPLADYLAIAALMKAINPTRVFEIGTFTGSTTLLFALNTNATIFTLDLPEFALAGSQFQGDPAAVRINQLRGRSESFDFTPYAASMDVVFIDAVHTYDAVKRDTASALTMLKPGGWIVWDDYAYLPQHADCAGVSEAVHEFARTQLCYRLAGTRLAIHRRA